ncbi:MAG: pyridoxal-phosphate dependent enzyme [Bacteroidota bacterium]
MQDINLNNITLDRLSLPVFTAKNIELSVLRLDKIHPVISGNKWFKLRYYLEDAKELGKKKIVTFGGAWSNHIIATAAACRLNGFAATGIIRGEEAAELSPTLKLAKAMGMQLIFISREDYSQKKIPEEINHDDTYFISEGGYGIKGAAGAATMLDGVEKKTWSHICCAAGTGTMTAGLVQASGAQNKIVAVSVLKNNFEIDQQVKSLLPGNEMNFDIVHDYHFGGYAKHKPELIHFMNEFYRLTSIPSDFVYTGKLFYAIYDLIAIDYFPSGSRLLLIHSGGLQGNASMGKGTLIF